MTQREPRKASMTRAEYEHRAVHLTNPDISARRAIEHNDYAADVIEALKGTLSYA